MTNNLPEIQKKRYDRLNEKFKQTFGDTEVSFISVPGRTEIAGNHTDHNHGRVLAASIDLDSVAAVSKNNDNKVVLFSEGFPEPFSVSLDDLKPHADEAGKTSALIRGIAAQIKKEGYAIGGFNAVLQSNVLVGSGLSSSASIEVLIGGIFSCLYNDGKISSERLAIIGQYAENNYFGKPCGLMDQLACATGGIVAIDFKDPQKPEIEKVSFNFFAQDYNVVVVNTGGNHADLTEDYASIPEEMKKIAGAFGASVCREINYDMLLNNIIELRGKFGDRAVLRAMHFLEENERVSKQVNALKENNFGKFLELVKESGNSSFRWLQNCYTIKNVSEQGVSLALALTENYLGTIGQGVCRVHGGGFAGTVQVFIPNKHLAGYVEFIEKIFGKGSAIALKIREQGVVFYPSPVKL
jgi:galactokinase